MLGSKGGKVLCSAADPHKVFVLLEWEDVQGAAKFAEAYETGEAMEWATGGLGSPRVLVLDELYEVGS
jgi:hypothetical protein